ncbi:hypothetical protein CC85DRAFT_288209, partial [Cutaneotrichosporon oleaginosum]
MALPLSRYLINLPSSSSDWNLMEQAAPITSLPANVSIYLCVRQVRRELKDGRRWDLLRPGNLYLDWKSSTDGRERRERESVWFAGVAMILLSCCSRGREDEND